MNCKRCGQEFNAVNPAQEIIENGKKVYICSDCYFGEMSDDVEKDPIVR